MWSFRRVNKSVFIEKVLETCVKVKSRFGVFSKDSRHVKIVDFQVFIFAYNHCCFFNNLLVFGCSRRQEFDSQCAFKGKVDECNSTS